MNGTGLTTFGREGLQLLSDTISMLNKQKAYLILKLECSDSYLVEWKHGIRRLVLSILIKYQNNKLVVFIKQLSRQI